MTITENPTIDATAATAAPATEKPARAPRKAARAPATARDRRAAYAYLSPAARVKMAPAFRSNPHRPGSIDAGKWEKVADLIRSAGAKGAKWVDVRAAGVDSGYLRKMAIERGYFVIA